MKVNHPPKLLTKMATDTLTKAHLIWASRG